MLYFQKIFVVNRASGIPSRKKLTLMLRSVPFYLTDVTHPFAIVDAGSSASYARWKPVMRFNYLRGVHYSLICL